MREERANAPEEEGEAGTPGSDEAAAPARLARPDHDRGDPPGLGQPRPAPAPHEPIAGVITAARPPHGGVQ